MDATSVLKQDQGVIIMMWSNNNRNHDHDHSKLVSEDDSWEVRAFEEDTAGNLLGGCTWPPRSYTCNFCRREFRSAQALGGHMNVHRRDRARLHHGPIVTPASPPEAPSVVLRQPAAGQDFVAGNGLCLVYPLPDHVRNAILIPAGPLNIPSTNYANPSSLNSSNNVNNYADCNNDKIEGSASAAMEELDLELRLGRRSP